MRKTYQRFVKIIFLYLWEIHLKDLWLALSPSSQPLILASADRNKRPICGFVDFHRIYNFLPSFVFNLFQCTLSTFGLLVGWGIEHLMVLKTYSSILIQEKSCDKKNFFRFVNFHEIYNFLSLSHSENAFLLQSFNRFTNSSAAVSWVFSWKSENLHFQCKMFWDQTRCSPWPWGGNFIFFNPIFQEASFPPKMHRTAKKGCFESKHKMHRSSLKNMTLEKYFFQIQTWRKPLLFLMDAHNHIKNSFESKYTLHSWI